MSAENQGAGQTLTAGKLRAVRTSSLREQVTRALEAAMVSGELKPGEVYSAPALGELFGVSATPVREAMQDLSKDGFVEAVRNRGFRVIEMSDTDLDEISAIRLLLEVPTTTELTGKVPAEGLAQLALIADEIVAAASSGDLIGYLDCDRHFHAELISFTGNRHLAGLVDRMRRQTRLFGLDDLVDSGRIVASAEEHHELLDALAGDDPEVTRELITSHIKHTRGLWVGRDEQ